MRDCLVPPADFALVRKKLMSNGLWRKTAFRYQNILRALWGPKVQFSKGFCEILTERRRAPCRPWARGSAGPGPVRWFLHCRAGTTYLQAPPRRRKPFLEARLGYDGGEAPRRKRRSTSRRPGARAVFRVMSRGGVLYLVPGRRRLNSGGDRLRRVGELRML